MNLIEKIKANKEKERQGFINPEIVEVVIENYDEIKNALNNNYSYRDIELALLGNNSNTIVVADICYIVEKVLKRYGYTPTQEKAVTEETKETEQVVEHTPQPSSKRISNVVARKPSRRSIAKYMQDNTVMGYVVVLLRDNGNYVATWIVSSNAQKAYMTAYAYYNDRDKKAGVEHTYSRITVSKMTYDAFLLQFDKWEDE